LQALVPALIEELKKNDAGHIIVVCGGVIPPKDYQFLYDAGAKAIYGPGTRLTSAAQDLIGVIDEDLKSQEAQA
jgi:methylmalonyl-CoA mutase